MTDYGPVFVHSLWRSGSTYIFSKFRAVQNFYCYQEPLHEALLFAVNEPEKLLVDGNFSFNFNHPKLQDPYFLESFEQHEHWKSIISKEMIYDQYFDQSISPELLGFYRALIDAAPRRVMVQECRTGARLGAIKDAVGGTHIHLWRRPWGQWWSFLKDRYFPLVMILILNARNAPSVLQVLRQELNIPVFHSSDIQEEFVFFDEFQLSARDNYKAFFAIWCLSFLEGRRTADIEIEINKLSDDMGYRQDIVKELINIGVNDINFDDCHILDPKFLKRECDFYRSAEREVLELLNAHGLSPDNIALLEQVSAVSAVNDAASPSYVAELRETGRTILDISSARVARLQQELQRHADRYEHDMAAMCADVQARLDVERQATLTVQQRLDAAEAASQSQELSLRRALSDANEQLAAANEQIASSKASLISTMQEAHEVVLRSSDHHRAEMAALYAQLLNEKDDMLALLRDRQAFEAELRKEIREQDAALAALQVEIAEQGVAKAALAQSEEQHREALAVLEKQLDAVGATHRLQERQLTQTIDGLEETLVALKARHTSDVEDLRSQILTANAMMTAAREETATAQSQRDLEREALVAFEVRHASEVEDLQSKICAATAMATVAEQEKNAALSRFDIEREALAAAQVAQNAAFAAHRADFEVERSSLQQQLDELAVRCRIADRELQTTRQLLDQVWHSYLPRFIKRRILGTDNPLWGAGYDFLDKNDVNVVGGDYVNHQISIQGAVMPSTECIKDNLTMPNSLLGLLAQDDVPFVHAAYLALLGREPDADGVSHYVAQLRSGRRKIEILKQLRRSAEGREYDASMPGLDKAISLANLARLPLIGIIVRWAKGLEGNSLAERRQRITSNNIAIIKQEMAQASHVMRQDEKIVKMQSMVHNIQQELGLIVSAQAEIAASNQEANHAFQAAMLAIVTPAEDSNRVPLNRTNARGPSAPGAMERFFAEKVWKI